MKNFTSVLLALVLCVASLAALVSCGDDTSAANAHAGEVWSSDFDVMADVNLSALIPSMASYYEKPEAYSAVKLTVTFNEDGTQTTVIDADSLTTLSDEIAEAVTSAYARSFEADAEAQGVDLTEALAKFNCSTLDDYKNMLKNQNASSYISKVIGDSTEYTSAYKFEDSVLYFYTAGAEFNEETAVKVSENAGENEMTLDLTSVFGEFFPAVTFTK